MSTIIIVFLILLNIFSIVLVYKTLGNIEFEKKAAIMIVAEIVMFVVVQILYNFSIGSIPAEIANGARTMLVFMFLPIDMMIMFAPIARNLAKIKNEEIKKEKFKSKMYVLIIIDVCLIIMETMYMNSIQNGIIRIIER